MTIKKVLVYAILLVLGLSMVFPFFWMISTALKTDAEIYRMPPELLPGEPKWSNFSKAWNSAPFNRYLLNTMLIAVATTFFDLLLSSLGGVAFGKYDFFGKKVLFALVLGIMVVPSQVTLIPNYLIMNILGWLNTYQGVIIVSIVSPFGIFLVRQYLQTIPDELMDAARIDGCSEWGIFFKILLPLIKPVLGTLAIFSFTGSWNSFMWPLILMDKSEMYTLQIGLAFFRGQHQVYPNLLMAINALAVIPIMILFLFCQKYFVAGIQMSGIKQ